MEIRIVGLRTLPEVSRGDDLAQHILDAAERENHAIGAQAVLVVAQKIVSKAEGCIVDLHTVNPSPLAVEWARQWGRDARLVELVLRESRRIVKMDRGVLITETHHGLIAANAGVDQSNIPGPDRAGVLPRDPDRSARDLRQRLGCGVVIVTDTFGRPWREGLVNVAIGVAGLEPLEDCRRLPDRCGRPMQATVLAVADELAAAAGLLMRKTSGVPVVLIEGLEWKAGEGSARFLLRAPERDLFR
jgi:coenzyme F420-0:L-glutamate ligase/coenzyme F420-1:gamma-L-glutamate ligase